MVVLAIIQLALALHVRTLVTDAAAEGARYAALRGNDLDAGAERTSELIQMVLPSGYAESISVRTEDHGTATIVAVTVIAPIPVLGLIGPSGSLEATGRAVLE